MEWYPHWDCMGYPSPLGLDGVHPSKSRDRAAEWPIATRQALRLLCSRRNSSFMSVQIEGKGVYPMMPWKCIQDEQSHQERFYATKNASMPPRTLLCHQERFYATRYLPLTQRRNGDGGWWLLCNIITFLTLLCFQQTLYRVKKVSIPVWKITCFWQTVELLTTELNISTKTLMFRVPTVRKLRPSLLGSLGFKFNESFFIYQVQD